MSLGFEIYKNPDERCLYPFSDCGAGYCWSFALHVDGKKGYEDMLKICPKCEFWLEEAIRRSLEIYAYGGRHDVVGTWVPPGQKLSKLEAE